MKKHLLNIFIFSSVLTILGFIMDGDPKEPSMGLRFLEFFAMFFITFLLTAGLYFPISFFIKKLKKT